MPRISSGLPVRRRGALPTNRLTRETMVTAKMRGRIPDQTLADPDFGLGTKRGISPLHDHGHPDLGSLQGTMGPSIWDLIILGADQGLPGAMPCEPAAPRQLEQRPAPGVLGILSLGHLPRPTNGNIPSR